MLAAASLAFLVLQAPSVQGLRESIRLDSGWTSQTVGPKDPCPTAGVWSTAPVPGFYRYSPRGGSHAVWYRRTLNIPASWEGRSIVLDLRSARYAPEVCLDGRLLARRDDGWSPLQVDLTPYVRAGESRTLTVKCHDYGVFLAGGFDSWPQNRGGDAITGKVLAPTGGYKEMMGLTAPAFLRSAPLDRLVDSETVIQTSVRKGQITVKGESSLPDGRVVAEVWDGARPVLRLPDAKGRAWTTAARFPQPRLWSPEDPFRYDLRLTLFRADGTEADRLVLKFGFRELWAEGPDFVLNGVKRKLLASATWPVQEWLSPSVVRERVKTAKESGLDAFRLHIGPWQEEFVEAADEIGLMIVEESAFYTDEGAYAYLDPRFWTNMKEHLSGMVRRDRNHPSVVMWSLGNEILFMGNERRDPDLPKKLGSLAVHVKALDPSRLTTMEADLDPDGKFDVIGLHYPHEMPGVFAYPEAADWVGTQKLTEAGGGMLGQKRSRFMWDRKKPLYIGEYLWIPVSDFSPGTVFFGEDAYLSRQKSTDEAKALSWVDQTMAYRRAGVSGLCPWSVFGFGMEKPDPRFLAAQKVFFKKQTAWLRDKGLRFFSGEKAALRYDVFNDGLKSARMTLQLLTGGKVAAEKSAVLAPSTSALMTLDLPVPLAARTEAFTFTHRLLADGREVEVQACPSRVFPRKGLEAPKGWRTVVWDPSGRWPGSVKTLPADPRGTVLIVANGALDTAPSKAGLPVVGASSFDPSAFWSFVVKGGRVLVLEQNSLAALGLGSALVDHAATMTFPLDPGHPVLKGLLSDDLKHWRGGGYVSSRELRRDPGMRAVAVSGGPESLAQGPIAEKAAGAGRILFMQCLAGSKRLIDPAAQTLVQNGVDYLASLPDQRQGKALVAGAGEADRRLLEAAGLDAQCLSGPVKEQDLEGAAGVVLVGGGPETVQSRAALAARKGLPVYWFKPEPEAFGQVQPALSDQPLSLEPVKAGPTLLDRSSALLRGVSREDLIFTSAPLGWERIIQHPATAADGVIVPNQASVKTEAEFDGARMRLRSGRVSLRDGAPAAFFDRIGSAEFTVSCREAGLRQLAIESQSIQEGRQSPVLDVAVNGVSMAWVQAPAARGVVRLVLPFAAGDSRVSLSFINGARWGGSMTFILHKASVSQKLDYPQGLEVLASPACIAAWTHKGARVVVDDVPGTGSPIDIRRTAIRLAAILANMGMPMKGQTPDLAEVLPTRDFKADGGPYNTVDPSRIELRSEGGAEAEFLCGGSGRYEIVLTGSSTPYKGGYAVIRAEIDGRSVGEQTLGGAEGKCVIGPFTMQEGRHKVRLVFANDASGEGEDRNVIIRTAAFRRV